MMKHLALLLLCTASAFASASNVYVAQSAAGGGTGVDCANAYAVTFFNTAGNWGAGAAQIGQDTTVHLCGTFTASAGANGYLTFQDSGASGHPITLLWETGAVVQSAYFGTGGAVSTNGKTYLVIDGGTNGVIQNTANGTVLANQQANSSGVVVNNCNG
jgi:hypothetical protein